MKITHKNGLIIRVGAYSELAQKLLSLSKKDDISYVVLQVEHIADMVIMEIVDKKLYYKEEKPKGTMPRFPGDIPTYNSETNINVRAEFDDLRSIMTEDEIRDFIKSCKENNWHLHR